MEENEKIILEVKRLIIKKKESVQSAAKILNFSEEEVLNCLKAYPDLVEMKKKKRFDSYVILFIIISVILYIFFVAGSIKLLIILGEVLKMNKILFVCILLIVLLIILGIPYAAIYFMTEKNISRIIYGIFNKIKKTNQVNKQIDTIIKTNIMQHDPEGAVSISKNSDYLGGELSLEEDKEGGLSKGKNN